MMNVAGIRNLETARGYSLSYIDFSIFIGIRNLEMTRTYKPRSNNVFLSFVVILNMSE